MWIQADHGSLINLEQQKGVTVTDTVVAASDGYSGGTILSEHETQEEAEARRDDIMAQIKQGARFYEPST